MSDNKKKTRRRIVAIGMLFYVLSWWPVTWLANHGMFSGTPATVVAVIYYPIMAALYFFEVFLGDVARLFGR